MRISTELLHRQGISSIQTHQVELSRLEQQLASGMRILNPSEDPLASARILQLDEKIQTTEQFQRNANYLSSRLSYEETILEGVGNNLQRIRELALQSNNATISAEDRATIAQELTSLREDLLALANSKDSDGNYLFSGYSTHTKPFSVTTNDAVNYNGDQGERYLQVSEDRQIVSGDSGDSVFMGIRNGNGDFVTRADAANTGTGVISIGSVTDRGAYVADDYTVGFLDNSNGELTYIVVSAALGVLIPAPPAVLDDAPLFVEGQAIEFNGIEIDIKGLPIVGDEFTLEPSENQDIFATLQNLIDAVASNPLAAADFAQMRGQIGNAIQDIDNSMNNVLNFRGQIGSRLNAVDMQNNINADAILDLKEVRASIRDIDYAEVISEMNQRLVSLQAAQQTYTLVQGLSLFNYL